jgi:type IV secretory pathway VirD2 relaxase
VKTRRLPVRLDYQEKHHFDTAEEFNEWWKDEGSKGWTRNSAYKNKSEQEIVIYR